MKSTVFNLKFPSNVPPSHTDQGVKFKIPTLRAYAVEYSEFSFTDGLSKHKQPTEGLEYVLVDDGLVWHSFELPFFQQQDGYRLVVHYHGIRDYSLLFPHVGDQDLRRRLGEFYEEAESNFENAAWLSYALMCGALYEGLLYHHFECQNDDFAELIRRTQVNNIVDEFTVRVMTKTRELRNLVHASRASTPFVDRSQAMDMRTVMDKLIKGASDWSR